MAEGEMSLQFIGDAGVYFPERDAVKVTAIAGDSVIDCYVTRSALEAIGCKPTDEAQHIVGQFEKRRLDCEIAAMVKFRRATAKLVSMEITAADLAGIDRAHAA
jgi:hypothetical protein